MEVVILADNKVVSLRPQGLKAEWGFSALILDKETILFDTGQTGVAFENFMTLRKNAPSKLVLSHGHYDHTGGILPFVRAFDLEIYAHPDAFLPRYFENRYIGILARKEQIESLAKIREHKEPVEVSKGITALGEIPRKYEQHLLTNSIIVRDKTKERDEIRDDQSLAIKTDNGLLLLLGCCHSGLRNTIEYAEEVVDDEVKFVVGGTHMIALKENELLDLVKWLDRKIELIAPCHCTGLENEFLLRDKLGDKYKLVGSGSVLEF